KKKKFMQEAKGSLKALQKALAASKRQKAKNLRRAQRSLSRLNDGLQKMVDTHHIQDALGNRLLDLVKPATHWLHALGSCWCEQRPAPPHGRAGQPAADVLGRGGLDDSEVQRVRRRRTPRGRPDDVSVGEGPHRRR